MNNLEVIHTGSFILYDWNIFGSSIYIVDILRIDDQSSILRSSIYRVFATFKLSQHSEIIRYVTWQDPYLLTKEQRTKALRRHREAESSSSKWSSKVMRLFTMYFDMQMGLGSECSL